MQSIRDDWQAQRALCSDNDANRIAVIENLINRCYDGERDMGEYMSEFESMFNKLAVMGSPMGNDMQAAILLISVSSEESLSGTISAIKTMDTNKAI